MEALVRISKSISRNVWGIVGAILALLVFLFLAVQAVEGLRQISTYELRINPLFLGLSFLSQIAGVVLSVVVWRQILSAFGVSMPFSLDFTIVGLSSLGRKIPGTFWYALGRISLYRRYKQPVKQVSLAIVYEIFILSLAGVVGFAISLTSGVFRISEHIPKIIPAVGLIALFAGMLRFFPSIIQGLSNLVFKESNPEGEFDFISIPTITILKLVIGEIAVILSGAFVAYFLFQAVHPIIDVPLAFIFGSWSLVVALGPLVLLLPAIIGLRSGLIYLLLAMSVTPNIAALATLIWRVWVLFLELLIGLGCGLLLLFDKSGEPSRHD